jgi:hypothetical protein
MAVADLQSPGAYALLRALTKWGHVPVVTGIVKLRHLLEWWPFAFGLQFISLSKPSSTSYLVELGVVREFDIDALKKRDIQR